MNRRKILREVTYAASTNIELTFRADSVRLRLIPFLLVSLIALAAQAQPQGILRTGDDLSVIPAKADTSEATVEEESAGTAPPLDPGSPPESGMTVTDSWRGNEDGSITHPAFVIPAKAGIQTGQHHPWVPDLLQNPGRR